MTAKERKAAWYQANKERLRDRARERYAQLTPEERRKRYPKGREGYKAEWHRKNRDRMIAKQRERYAANRDAINAKRREEYAADSSYNKAYAKANREKLN